MAKISAHGERVHTRFKDGSGGTIVLTVRPDLRPGRLLRKHPEASQYQMVKRFDATPRRGPLLLEAAIEVEEFAVARGYEKVSV